MMSTDTPPPYAGTLLLHMLTSPETWWRAQLPKMPRERRLWLFDGYYSLAEYLKGLGLNPQRKPAYSRLIDFAWRLNDLVAELHDAQRGQAPRRLPWFAKDLLKARRRGLVPAMVDGIHVSLGLRAGYRAAAHGAFIAVPAGAEYSEVDFKVVAGLDVEILACRVDLLDVGPLARELALQGAHRVVARYLDSAWQDELLYDGTKPWRPSSH